LFYEVPDDGGEEAARLEVLEVVGDEEGAQEQEAGHQEGVRNIVTTN
jgi:hypothetical protein